MPEMTLVIFGKPTAGAAVMLAAPLAGLDLPLKILVWEDGNGAVSVSYNSPGFMAEKYRLEARCAVKNGRGNGALHKVGAVQEGVLRKAFLKNGEYLDQVLYAIVEDDWRKAREAAAPVHLRVH